MLAHSTQQLSRSSPFFRRQRKERRQLVEMPFCLRFCCAAAAVATASIERTPAAGSQFVFSLPIERQRRFRIALRSRTSTRPLRPSQCERSQQMQFNLSAIKRYIRRRRRRCRCASTFTLSSTDAVYIT